MPPIIGIAPAPATAEMNHGTFDRWFVGQNYVDAVAATGAVPIILPPFAGDTLAALELIDGLLLIGGADVHPARYGATDIHPRTYGIDDVRDNHEFALLGAAQAKDLPVLGICRGIQVLNVALAGTLLQDIPDQRPQSHEHRQETESIPSWEPGHVVQRIASSPLDEMFTNDRLNANSFHHQAIDQLAPGLEVVAVAEDGLIEAVIDRRHSFLLGVQWHPELMYARHSEHLVPFQALTNAAIAYRASAVV